MHEICNICINSYHCDCLDNVIRANICKHIHTCAQEFNEGIDDVRNNFSHEVNIEAQQMLLEMFATPIIVYENQKIHSQAELILGLSQNKFDEQNREKIEKKMAEVMALMNDAGKKIIFNPVTNVNTQQKIVPKMHFYLTKKNRFEDNFIPKPTESEINAIVSGLENDNSETINIHSAFNH